MKLTNVFTLAGFVLAGMLFSCKKNGSPAAPQVTPPVIGTLSINMDYSSDPNNDELIISEAGGKVLLDTLGFNGRLAVNLKTDQKLVDFTRIMYESSNGQYLVTTYKGVNPSNWVSAPLYDFSAPIGQLPTADASILYTHVPFVSHNYMTLYDYSISFGQYDNASAPNTFRFTYSKHGSSNYLYLLLPEAGLYNLHIPKGITDTVDLSHMDTATKLNFNKPALYTTISDVALVGIMDTTDYARSLILYIDGVTYPTGAGYPNLIYPRKYVKKYELYVNASYNTGSATYYSYADSVPTTLPLLDESSYTVAATQNANFSIKIQTPHPTYYFSAWKNAKMRWELYASPDSTTLNPLRLLTALKSKMLQGQDLTSLSYLGSDIAVAQGLDYTGYFSYICNPASVAATRLTSLVSLFKQ